MPEPVTPQPAVRPGAAPPAGSRPQEYGAVVVGGGFMGSAIALYLRERVGSVLLLEREPELLGRASFANQARVHNGYHYPRSLLTGVRSRVNFPRFVEEFADCIVNDFDKYYAVARRFSKVTAEQFATFCRRIEAPVERASAEVRALFDRQLIEDVFLVREYAFDAVRLRAIMRRNLAERGVDVRTGAEALRVAPHPGGGLRLEYAEDHTTRVAVAGEVYNCTYSGLNGLLVRSGLPVIPLRHELTELALVEVPDPLRRIGVTVMCGPFFSVMPFPSAGLHSFSHVRYTPHNSWVERTPDDVGAADSRQRLPAGGAESNFPRMVLDARRYMPALADVHYAQSLFEVKTVLPSSEVDDSRPIMFKRDHGLPNLTCILGGKIDNVFDALAELDAGHPAGSAR